jgi:hypothetical protein
MQGVSTPFSNEYVSRGVRLDMMLHANMDAQRVDRATPYANNLGVGLAPDMAHTHQRFILARLFYVQSTSHRLGWSLQKVSQ